MNRCLAFLADEKPLMTFYEQKAGLAFVNIN